MITEDEAAPPPPPLSPPPAQEATTIGKYIARFRYERPQPREARAAAQRSDFWWTKSPRYTRSPSPPSPSTWASAAFAFPYDEEEETEMVDELAESKDKILAEDEESVEKKWRQRLGLSNSDSGQGINNSELSEAKSPAPQLWSSEEWEAVDLEEEEDEVEEDPEQVIERVRRRLNWGTTTARPKSMESPLVINTDRRDGSRGQLRTKPPLSPGFRREDTSGSFGFSSPSSWGTIERDFGDDQFVKSSLSSADAKDAVVDGKEEGKSRDLDEVKTIRPRSEKSAEESETQSVYSELRFVDMEPSGMRSSNSSVGSYGSLKSGGSNDVSVVPIDESNGEGPATIHFDSAYENNAAIDKPEEKLQSNTVPEVSELPQLPPLSPARPNLALDLVMPSPDHNRSVRSQDSSSSSSRGTSETAKTLDNLVSLVVHSWESDFFSPSRQEDLSPINDQQVIVTGSNEDSSDMKVSKAPVSPDAKLPSKAEDLSEDNETKTVQEPTATEISADVLLQESTQPDPDEEENDVNEVPGEEDDKVVQMLLGRILLLEEALRQLDG
ncbi:hypothetical protein V7S43_010238 [Phytophthora oleae]|uniref:Uncharacterized protein n=1 Tax=Phytophthora oleae TaxID=2107226 RepID=A0ABD3FDU4_9STRA